MFHHLAHNKRPYQNCIRDTDLLPRLASSAFNLHTYTKTLASRWHKWAVVDTDRSTIWLPNLHYWQTLNPGVDNRTQQQPTHWTLRAHCEEEGGGGVKGVSIRFDACFPRSGFRTEPILTMLLASSLWTWTSAPRISLWTFPLSPWAQLRTTGLKIGLWGVLKVVQLTVFNISLSTKLLVFDILLRINLTVFNISLRVHGVTRDCVSNKLKKKKNRPTN